jgi:rsbT co-antagonist protein RsbR
MGKDESAVLARVFRTHEQAILADWIRDQDRRGRVDALEEVERRRVSREVLAAIRESLGTGSDVASAPWSDVREILESFSSARAAQGYSPVETATFLFALKQPVFERLRGEIAEGPALADALWQATLVIDALGLHITEAFQKAREQVIARQHQELLELSTPVVELWDGILALPLIGTLDSNRTQVVMASLLERLVECRAAIAIIDITGVPTVDTLVAQHLMKTVAAARLMGADCIISGIRPQIAQTIVHLGVDLTNVTTKATMRDALATALARTGSVIRPLRQGARGGTAAL